MIALADGYMRNTVREAFNDVASKMPVQDIYGAGKSKMLADVTKKCRDVLGKDGFVIDQLTINGALRLPQNVADAINRAMEATQNAIQSENQVRQVKAEAEQAITQAHGQAEAARQKAEGEADALLIRARGRRRRRTRSSACRRAPRSCSTARSSTGTASSPRTMAADRCRC